MKKILIISLLLISCNRHNGKIIDDGVWICTHLSENLDGCSYTFATKHDYIRVDSDCGKWNIGDTL
jgi:ribosomal protein L37AE/L43A